MTHNSMIIIFCLRLIPTQQGVADRKKFVSIPLRIKIQQEQIRISESETHKPANDRAKFKQSTQCCSQWGPTSTSRLWNVERSMIKEAERALYTANWAISVHTQTVTWTVHKASHLLSSRFYGQTQKHESTATPQSLFNLIELQNSSWKNE